MNRKISVVSLFISDVHIGIKESGSADLLSMLEIIDPTNIFLVGDIIDIRAIRRNKNLRLSDFLVSMRILKAMNSAKMIYLPGNHDSEIAELSDYLPSGLSVLSEYTYVSKAGRRMLIFHGHQVDTHAGTRGEVLVDVICFVYAAALRFQGFLRQLFPHNVALRSLNLVGRARFIFPSWKKHLANFERRVRLYSEERGFSAAVCGHIHVPKVTQTEGFAYYNTGDWIENRTALVETLEGEFELVVFDPSSGRISFTPKETPAENM